MSTLKLAKDGDEPVKRSVRYLRVSSKRQLDTDADIDPDGNSIDTQRKVCQARERTLGLVNVDEYIEPGNSAQSIEKRPVFRQMLKRIIEQRDVDCVIIYMRSRAFRNFGDAVITERQFKQLGVEVISAKEDFGDGIWADAMKAIADVVNEVQVRQNGEDIRVKMLNKAKNGGTNGRAKLGYRNTTKAVDGHKVNIIAVDTERRQYVELAFELFATGEYTIDSLQAKLTEAGLRMPGSGKPVSTQTVQKLLRDRYYMGILTYRGMEYQGRHEPLIGQELYERVQRVLDAHSGAGTRQRTHHHYLKGLLWCERCKQRFIVQRAKGNGGIYYYFFCRGRQEKVCDHPFVPVEVMEQAVIDHYGVAVHLPEAFRAEVRAEVDRAVGEHYGLSEELRDSLSSRLVALDRKEDYYLELAAEEGWPKDKLRLKIHAIRQERKDIQRSLEQTESELATGKQLFYDALALLDDPQAMYRRGSEQVRSILNQAFFTRLYVDGRKITGQDYQEPFDALMGAYQVWHGRSQSQPPQARYYRRSLPLGAVQTRNNAALLGEDYGVADRATLIDSLGLALGASGSSKTVMVELRGLEPLAPCLQSRCSSS